MVEDFDKKPISDFLEEKLIKLIDRRDGAAIFPTEMFKKYPAKDYATSKEIMRGWELAGLRCRDNKRFSDAIDIFDRFYEWLLEYQEITGNRIHKGNPLVWMSQMCSILGYHSIAKRLLMLTLCEDSISGKGKINPETSGVYFRLVWQYGMNDADLQRYADEIFKKYQSNPKEGLYPERILQELDNEWITIVPSPNESMLYRPNCCYIKHLFKKLGDKSGEDLEHLAEYILSVMPGCRTYRRKKTHSTDYDIVCSMEGTEADFRSEFGRYFVCECKDWDKPADFTTISKFCRILDSAKCRFGILFSKKGISGSVADPTPKYAARELVKVFQDRGMVIVVINENDLKEISEGKNIITILRTKYETARLDLL